MYLFEGAWYESIKRDGVGGCRRKKSGTPSIMPEDESDIERRKSNEKISKSPSMSLLSPSSTATKISSPDDIKQRICQYRQIIDYFSSLTSSINVNLLFEDSPYMMEDLNQTQLTPQDPSVIIVIIHQLIDTVMEEARFVEAQLQKYTDLNREFSNDILPKLYQNIRKEVSGLCLNNRGFPLEY